MSRGIGGLGLVNTLAGLVLADASFLLSFSIFVLPVAVAAFGLQR
jgi:hypothetical protein